MCNETVRKSWKATQCGRYIRVGVALSPRHYKLLSEGVWNHTIVLFTKGDSTEQNIERGGKSLQLLLQKCGNRYHILDTKNKDNSAQVIELLEKIEEVVEKNRGEEIKVHHLPELRIVMLGERGAGKSSAANTILGRELFDTERVTGECQKRHGQISERQITAVDTPGWNGTSEQETFEWVKEEIVESVTLCPPGPHALLLVIPVGSSMSGTIQRCAKEAECSGEKHLPQLVEKHCCDTDLCN
ncbi:hypothetical protein JZ751_026591 [Albula glossodonta]|uniref:AIG1-type G domain-containing protein n=1 Tax=Albula glossodonta TaxID=121402 RepID=A0A8T2PLT4_9TELE|nr:hypothetical protein JZ751_026591 [Albula glossodonta]